MNSFNHYAYGAIGDWLYQVVAGIDVAPEVPGYRRILIQPQPGGGLTSAEASLDSMYGRIESKWILDDDRFQLTVTIPPNSEAVVRLPAQNVEHITEQGQPLDQAEGILAIHQEDDTVILSVASGRYAFAVTKH